MRVCGRVVALGLRVYGSMVLCCMPPPNFLSPLYFLLSKRITKNVRISVILSSLVKPTLIIPFERANSPKYFPLTHSILQVRAFEISSATLNTMEEISMSFTMPMKNLCR